MREAWAHFLQGPAGAALDVQRIAGVGEAFETPKKKKTADNTW